MKITFDRGSILINGNIRVPNSTWDERSKSYRAMALNYKHIIDYLERSGLDFEDRVLNLLPCPELRCAVKLRDYQKQAMEAWTTSGNCGVVVLPTGSGKTIIGIKAIALLNTPAIVIAPTLDLVNQWHSRLEEEFKIDVGLLGGGEKDIKALTVSTYDSAYIHAERLGNKFGLIIFDEVHHLPAEGFRNIAEMFASPSRIGLTATFEREDGLHSELNRLVGGKVFERRIKDLAGFYLSPFRVEKISVELTAGEKTDYEISRKILLDYLSRSNLNMGTPADFQRLVMRSGRDPAAREALLARNRARDIAFNSESKMGKLAEILKMHNDSRVFIFTEHNKLVHRISRKFLIPSITYKTTARERTEILNKFRSGAYKAVVTSKVLDEGIDVPDADVGIILSGTGSERAFVQRLGRILRKIEGKEAVLYEIVSAGTSETGVSSRRKRPLRS